jgi:hypothetical protein
LFFVNHDMHCYHLSCLLVVYIPYIPSPHINLTCTNAFRHVTSWHQ